MLRFARAKMAAGFVVLSAAVAFAQVAGQNINMVSGTTWPAGDPFLQRQNEPSMAVSSRNPEHLMGGANDYRTVDIPNPLAPTILGDAWVGVYTSLDGGETFRSTLLPGYPQDTSAVGKASPLHAFTVATDPTVRAGTNGMFYYSGLVFNRGAGTPSGVFVATLQDQNNKGNGDAAILMSGNNGTHGNPFLYVGATLVDSGNSGQFLDKPWVVVDIPRAGRTATCTVNGQTFSSGYVYLVYTQFNGSQNNPASKIKESTSTDCGKTWSQPQVLSQSQKLAQGTVAAIDPSTGNVYVAWRQIAVSGNQNQQDAMQWAVSTNGGWSFQYEQAAYTFTASSSSYPAGSVFDQPQASSTTFRTLDVPSLAVDGTGRVWLAFSVRVNGPTKGTYGSRIMLMTLPPGSTKWTTATVADATAPSSAYGHQFMPSLSFAYGKMALAWYDSRRDNLQSILKCNNAPCTDLSQVTPTDVPIPGSALTSSPANYSAVFTPLISDPNSGVRHTVDVYGAVFDPSKGPQAKGFNAFQISQYPYYVDDTNNQIEQGFFNPPNLPMFVQGTTPFMGDYIDIAAQSIMPSGNSWVFNTQATDATGATNAPDFHVTWTDNRDVVPPPVVNGNQDWTQYQPPNSGSAQTSVYSGTGGACPTCSTTQPACTTVTPDGAANGEVSAYSGDRNQNVYTSRISNGLIVRFKENAKTLSSTVQQRSFSLLIKNTISPLSTSPLGSPSYYRVLLGATSTSQAPSCTISGGTAVLTATNSCYLDVAVNPKTTLTQAITVTSTVANPSVSVLVAQITAIPQNGTAPVFAGLQALAVINADPSNPSVANPDFIVSDPSNPDIETPYGALPITAGEEYDPTVDGPPDPTTGIFTPKIGAPDIFTPKIGNLANNSPTIATPTIFTPKITSVQIANPTIVNTIFTPKIFTPKIFTPKIVSPDIFTPKITDLSDSGGGNSITDFSWKVTNKGNTSGSYGTTEFAKAAGVSCCPSACTSSPNFPNDPSCTVNGQTCSVCQIVQHKVYESPVANRDSSNLNPTCDLNVQQQSIVVSNITSPAFQTVGIGSASDPTNSTLSLSPGEGNRVTLRVVNPPSVNQSIAPFKTVATGFNHDTGQNTAPTSLTITTTALPVAVVNQPYTATALTSIGGLGASAWSVPADPNNPVAASLPISPEALPVTPLFLSQSGQITSTGNVSSAPGSYTVYLQVQDAAPTPSLDVQQLPLSVNQFTIMEVNVMIANQVGTTSYMKAGDVAQVAITLNNQGPATISSVTPLLVVNAVADGQNVPYGSNTPPTTPVLSCTPLGNSGLIAGNSTGTFTSNCTVVSGNGEVTFTASATGAYITPGASAVSATATSPNNPAVTTVSEPTATPSSTPPNIIVDTNVPTLTFANANPSANQYGWNNTYVAFSYNTGDNLAQVKTSPPSPLVLSTEGTNVTGTVTLTDYANNSTFFTAPTNAMPPVNIDLTPPSITASSSYSTNVWTNQNVTVTFNCTDNLSGPLVVGGANPITNPIITGLPASGATVTYAQSNNGLTSVATVTLTAETPKPGATLIANCQDAADNKATQVQFGPILIDKTPPVVTATGNLNSPTGTPYTAGTWTNQSVVVTFSCADSLSGPKPGSITGNTSYGSQGTYTANGSCMDIAGNTGNGSFGPVLIDTTTPGVLITSPQNQTYVLNQTITPSFTCPDNGGGDTTTCTGTPASGPYAATPVGPSTFSVHAVDQAGNATSTDPSVNYLVIYNFTGFQAPLQAAVMMNPPNPPTPPQPSDSGSITVGTTIPIAWQLQDATQTYISDPTTVTSITAIANPTCTGTVSGTPTTLYDSMTNQSALTYDTPNNRFVFSWNTAGLTPGCYNVVVTTNDTAQWSTIVHIATDSFAGFDAPLTTASAPANPSNSGTLDLGATVPVMFALSTPNGPVDSSQNASLSNVTAYANANCSGAPPQGSIPTILYDLKNNIGSFNFEPTMAMYTVSWNTSAATAGCYNIVATLTDQAVYGTIVKLASPAGSTTLVQYNFDNVPQGAASQTAPASYAATGITASSFAYSGSNPNGMFNNGCVIGDCIDPTGDPIGASYTFSFTNTTPITGGVISFSEYNNDCYQQASCTGASFVVQYSTTPSGTPIPIGTFTPATGTSTTYSSAITGPLPPGTYYFQITATTGATQPTAQYVFDNVTITGSH